MNTDKMTKAQLISILGEANINASHWMERAQKAEAAVLSMSQTIHDAKGKIDFLTSELELANQELEERRAMPVKTLKPMQKQLWEMVSGKNPIHELWYEIRITEVSANEVDLCFDKDLYKSNIQCQAFLAFVKSKMLAMGHKAGFTSDSLRIKRADPAGEPAQENNPDPMI